MRHVLTIQNSTLQGSLHLVVAWATGRTYAARVVKMSDVVAGRLRSHAERAVEGLTNPTPYAPDADMEDNSHMEAPRDESLDTALIEELSKGASLDLATDDELRDSRLVCHALVVTSSTETILLVKKRSPIQLAKKSLVASLVHGRLDELESPLFAFDNRYDVIVASQAVYILDKKAFEGLFKNSPAVLDKTSDWIRGVATVISFSEGSVEQLDTVLKRNSVLRSKFLAVKERTYLNAITPDALRDEIVKHGLEPDNLMDGDSLKVTGQNAKDVLRLLNEDLFSGGFSQQRYAASAKRAIS